MGSKESELEMRVRALEEELLLGRDSSSSSISCGSWSCQGKQRHRRARLCLLWVAPLAVTLCTLTGMLTFFGVQFHNSRENPTLNQSYKLVQSFDLPILALCMTRGDDVEIPFRGSMLLYTVDLRAVVHEASAQVFSWYFQEPNPLLPSSLVSSCLVWDFPQVYPSQKLAPFTEVEASASPGNQTVWGSIFASVQDSPQVEYTAVYFFQPGPTTNATFCYDKSRTNTVPQLGFSAFLTCLSSSPNALDLAPIYPNKTVILDLAFTSYEFLDDRQSYSEYAAASTIEIQTEVNPTAGSGAIFFTVRNPDVSVFRQEYPVTVFNLLVNLLLAFSATFSAWRVSQALCQWLLRWYLRRRNKRLRDASDLYESDPPSPAKHQQQQQQQGNGRPAPSYRMSTLADGSSSTATQPLLRAASAQQATTK